MQITAKHDAWDRWRLPLLALAVVLIVILPSLLLRQMSDSTLRAADWVSHSQEVTATLSNLEANMRDMESAAMAMSHDVDSPILRARFNESRTAMAPAMARLVELTRDNADQQVRIGRLQSTLERRGLLAARIAENRDPERIRALILEMTADNPIRGLIADLQKREDALLAERTADADQRRMLASAISWVSLAVQLLLLGLVIWLLQRQIGRRLDAERHMLRANARAAAVLQTVREPIVLLDSEQRMLMHNAAFGELYGLDQEQAPKMLAEVGDGVWQDGIIVQRLADVLLRGRELWDFEHEQLGADGVARTMLLNARRMPLPDSEDQVVLMTVSDISLQKASQQRIQMLNRQLEGKVEQVSEVNRELEAFSYSVSHDLRAPLRHVAGFADKLARHLGDAADEKSRHYLEVIGTSARRMASLIDDLLVYSRLGRSALRLQAVDMQSLVAETRSVLDANYQSDHAGSGHRIEWSVAPLPILVADENMMRQLWLNLLGNAVKYSARREVAVIEVGYQLQADGSHRFSVRDNGAGFDMAYATKLFGVFQRLHKASEYTGTGIGLASVRRVLTRHGGHIWADAAPDMGATFHFVLPPAPEAPTNELTA
ncbi:histidine kinase [Xanthomonas translucens pv. arrhenatheri]|jgi:PAS domain S-box-containing protein|uniref:histidine kinase n=2 Tax=Xanthomonas graminis TaxID=3390026 RepID=A0A0K3A4D2_9XANT|nr:ATP-binding protein [Xanthomonas translucens]EKU24208.1 two-component system sensor histidine kinase [Xanthomonas translucens pv. graminis ART-Xtg29]OAX60160.1 histidine kinase [Xanthomonas translucens pv. graminis]OAX64515.1 histidine kinase [Xanthomonas translucens pv. arrhenatheri]UKE55038.1 CHASE3 domain-containing protein [Xanthomonas translucens pv. graminis]UKE78357.1 CHASE3 domain-containing protein [Xanthomonas translucens pv. arrhenatheri]